MCGKPEEVLSQLNVRAGASVVEAETVKVSEWCDS